MDGSCSLPSVLAPTRLKFLSWRLLRSCIGCFALPCLVCRYFRLLRLRLLPWLGRFGWLPFAFLRRWCASRRSESFLRFRDLSCLRAFSHPFRIGVLALRRYGGVRGTARACIRLSQGSSRVSFCTNRDRVARHRVYTATGTAISISLCLVFLQHRYERWR